MESIQNSDRSEDMNAQDLWVQSAEEHSKNDNNNEVPSNDNTADEVIDRINDCILAMHRFTTASNKQEQQHRMNLISPTRLLQAARGAPQRPALLRGIADRNKSADLLKTLDELAVCTKTAYQDIGINAANEIIYKLAKIPLLMKTIVLLKDDDDHKLVMAHPCIRRVMCCKDTALSYDDQLSPATDTSLDDQDEKEASMRTKSWILDTLRGDDSRASRVALHRRRCVEYFETISNLTTVDYISILISKKEIENYKLEVYHPDEEYVKMFQTEQKELFDTISSLHMLIPYLFAMSNTLMEQAALTPVIENALRSAAQRPVMIAQVFVDLVFYLLLVLAVRNFYVQGAWDNGLIDGNTSDTGWFAIWAFGPTTLVYVFGRTLMDLLACSQISRTVFLQNLMFRWTMVDIASDILLIAGVVVSVVTPNEQRVENWYYAFQAIVLGSIWLKAFGFMQNLNPKLSVYVISLFEILGDSWQFLLIFVVLTLGFGDMFHASYIAFRDDNSKCPFFGNSDVAQRVSKRVVSPFCSGSKAESYMAVYRLLVGEASISDFNADNFTSLLFVMASFFGVILLLNLLIAVVVESYERAMKRSKGLFGRTRIAFIAKNILAEEGLQAKGCIGVAMRIIFKACTFAILFYVAMVSTVYYGELVGYKDPDVRLAIATACITWFLLLHQAVMVLKRRRVLGESNFLVRIMQGTANFLFWRPAAWITQLLLAIPKEGEHISSTMSKDDDSEKSKAILRCERRIQQLEEDLRVQNEGYQRLLVELTAMEARLLG